MKTKTITYHAPINNGSFFQAYALQKTLESLGIENEILDIQPPELKRDYALFRRISSVTDIAKNVISLVHYSKLKTRKCKFEKARQDYLKMSKEYDSLEAYLNENEPVDSMFIAGSDQIWNTKASDFTEGYFLPGIKHKIAYSVSGGTHITLSDLKKYKNYVKEFRAISVRENDLKSILEQFGLTNIHVTVDPTLLLQKADYLHLASKTPFIGGKYIFLYTVKCEPEVLKLAKRISNQTGLPVYAIFNTYRSEGNKLYGVKNIYNAGPFDFLNIIQNAEFVLTDSFHGNVFSILMEKEFYYVSKTNDDGKPVRDDRIDDFLGKIGLLDRKISSRSTFFRRQITEQDIMRVSTTVSFLKNEAISYLQYYLME